jgi:hypothetical protein
MHFDKGYRTFPGKGSNPEPGMVFRRLRQWDKGVGCGFGMGRVTGRHWNAAH